MGGTLHELVAEESGPVWGLAHSTISPNGQVILATGTAPREAVGVGIGYFHTEGGWEEGSLLRCGATSCGNAVALSYDGGTAITENGFVFARSGESWTQQGVQLPCGGAVALSYSGDTALVGGCLFRRIAGTWRTTGGKMEGGSAAALSAQGNPR